MEVLKTPDKLSPVQILNGKNQLCFMLYSQVEEKYENVRSLQYELKIFEENHLFIDDESPTFDGYYTNIENNNVVGSQKSMLVLETYFLCKCVSLKTRGEVTILYIGGYPGDHINSLAVMFPNFTFHVFDKLFEKNLKIKEHKNVKIYMKMFSDNDIGSFKSFENLYMISDIRNTMYEHKITNTNVRRLNAKIIEDDMLLQKRWAFLLKDNLKYAFMRFRPRLNEELSAINEYYSLKWNDIKNIFDEHLDSELHDTVEINDNISEQTFMKLKEALISYIEKDDHIKYISVENLFKNILNFINDDSSASASKKVFTKTKAFQFLHENEKLIQGFYYPTGVLIKMPFAKPNINTTMIILNDFDKEELYFDKDIMARLNYHKYHERKTSIYLNPFSGQFNSLLSLSTIKKWKDKTESTVSLPDSHYVMGSGWDARAVFYIIGLYFNYIGSEITYETISSFILKHFTSLEILEEKITA